VTLRSDTVARVYALRNWVEEFYKEAKDDLGAGQYQVRDLESIVRHWQMVFAAYSLVVTLKREHRLERWCKKLHTLRQTLFALRDYLWQKATLVWLPGNLEVLKEHLQLKGYLFNVELTK
jgi:hypothetical protein